MQLAMLDLEAGKPENVEPRFDLIKYNEMPDLPQLAQMMGNVMPKVDDARPRIYRAAVHEITRCLGDAKTVPTARARSKK